MSKEANPILVAIYRENVLESFHRGVICAVNKNGEIIFSAGDVNQICYPRSAMKLLQVIPLIELGGIEHFGFTLEEIALMCGSHNAENDHLLVLDSILRKCGCSRSDLLCGSQFPTHKPDADLLIRNNEKPTAAHNNCSGKHAGMLALCKLTDNTISDYIHPDHPVQILIRKACADMYEYDEHKMIMALDGCSAPIFSVPVYHQALAYKNLANPDQFDDKRKRACTLVIQAVSTYPFMVAGTKRYCTDLMTITAPKIIGKTGAEGIFCMSLTEQQIGICIKIDDGKMLPQYNVAQALVDSTGLFDKATLAPLHHYAENEIKNFNKCITGRIKTATGLFDGIKI